MMDQPIFNLWNELVGDYFATLSTNGKIRCHVSKLPLLPGRYSFNVFCQVGMEIADWVLNAYTIEVVEGDFFGTGRLPPPSSGDLLVLHHHWEVNNV